MNLATLIDNIKCLSYVSKQNIDLTALNLDRNATSLDALFGENDAEVSDVFDKTLEDLDICNAHCSSHLDHAYLINQVSPCSRVFYNAYACIIIYIVLICSPLHINIHGPYS